MRGAFVTFLRNALAIAGRGSKLLAQKIGGAANLRNPCVSRVLCRLRVPVGGTV